MNDILHPVLQFIGIALVGAALGDVYLTVLQGGTVSIFSSRLNRLVWKAFRLAGARRPNSQRLLTYAGPTLIAATLIMWVALLLTGFALMYWPALGSGVVASSGSTPTGFLAALYVSGFSLSTLVAGDLIAQSNGYRLLMVLEALVGFSVVTASLTYLLSVYSAITSNNAAATWLQHAAGDKRDAAGMLAHLGPGGDFSNAEQTLSTISHDLVTLIESHHTHPVLRYFRFSKSRLSVPRTAILALDACALIDCALDDRLYKSLKRSVAVVQLQAAGMQLVNELGEDLLSRNVITHEEEKQESSAWRQHYRQSLEFLRKNDVGTTTAVEDGKNRYLSQCRAWLPTIASFSAYLGYDWATVVPENVNATLAEH